ncbi:hypothetical protein PT2222_90335 [Paraburkholderia tropica]
MDATVSRDPLADDAGANVMLAREMLDDVVDATFDRGAVRSQGEVGVSRRMIRRADARELGNLTAPCALVQPLRVAFFADFERRIDEHFHEPGVAHDASRIVAVFRFRRDRRGDGDKTFPTKQIRHVSHAAEVFGAVGFAEAQIGVEAGAQHVAVEHGRANAERFQSFDQRTRDCRFARPGHAGEPDDGTRRCCCFHFFTHSGKYRFN